MSLSVRGCQMLSAQDKELYKKFSMNEKISQLRERLKVLAHTHHNTRP